MEHTSKLIRRPWVASALLVALASQISINLFTQEFNISVAVILLPVLLFLTPDIPLFPTAALAAPGVFLLRCLIQGVTTFSLQGCIPAHAPEIFFYLTYGLLFDLYARRCSFHPFRAKLCLPLVGIDVCANFVELLIRLGWGVFSPSLLFQLLAVGIGRSLFAFLIIRTLDNYGFQVLRRDDAERYQRLLLMTATLKSEVAWMDKGTALIENTMNAAYRLYSQLRAGGADEETAGTALTIAKDIHEVKKEYFLIMRGISEALERASTIPGMELEELFSILTHSVERTAQACGKEVVCTTSLSDNFYTTQHHYLMSIFRNLLNNALEAAGTGHTAHLTLTQRRERDDFLFTVEDDCGGIPPQRMAQIFTPGFSSKINYTTGEINRGLGLTIVKDLVEEELHGTIQVSSQNGGTLFTIRIPMRELEGTQHAVLSD